MKRMFGAPSRARMGAGHAGWDTSNVRPITPGNAWPDLYSLSAMGVSVVERVAGGCDPGVVCEGSENDPVLLRRSSGYHGILRAGGTRGGGIAPRSRTRRGGECAESARRRTLARQARGRRRSMPLYEAARAKSWRKV